MVVIHKAEAYFIKSCEVASNSGEQYYQVVKEVKKKLEEQGIIVGAIVGDNASAVQNALNRHVYVCVVTLPHFHLCTELRLKILGVPPFDVRHTHFSCS